LRFLHEHADDNDTFPNSRYIESAGDAVSALHPHFPERALNMLNVRLADPLQTKFLDQSGDMDESRRISAGSSPSSASTTSFNVSTVHGIVDVPKA
jgi:hypothetical protein